MIYVYVRPEDEASAACECVDRQRERGAGVVDAAEGLKTKRGPKRSQLGSRVSRRFRFLYPTTPGSRRSHERRARARWRPSRGPRATSPGPRGDETARARSRPASAARETRRRRAADRRASIDATGQSTAPMTRRDACAALACRGVLGRRRGRARGHCRGSRAYDGRAASYDDLDGGAFAAGPLARVGRDPAALLARSRGACSRRGWARENLPGYDATRVTSLTAVDISRGMTKKPRRARGRRACSWTRRKSAATFAAADAERLPFPDASRLRGGHVFAVRFRRPRGGAPGGATRAEARRYGAARRAHQVQNSASAGRVPGPRRRAGDEHEQGCAWNQDVVAMATRAAAVTSAEPGLAGLLTTLEATVAEGFGDAGVSSAVRAADRERVDDRYHPQSSSLLRRIRRSASPPSRVRPTRFAGASRCLSRGSERAPRVTRPPCRTARPVARPAGCGPGSRRRGTRSRRARPFLRDGKVSFDAAPESPGIFRLARRVGVVSFRNATGFFRLASARPR